MTELFPPYNTQYPKDLMQETWHNLAITHNCLRSIYKKPVRMNLGSNIGSTTRSYGSFDELSWVLTGAADRFLITSSPKSTGKHYELLVEGGTVGKSPNVIAQKGLLAYLVTHYEGGYSTTDDVAGLLGLNDVYVVHSAARSARQELPVA